MIYAVIDPDALPMNGWLWAASVGLVAMVPALVACYRGTVVDRIASLGMAGLLATVELLLLVEGFNRPSFFDIPLTLAILSFGSGMVFVRFAQRWL